MIFKYDENPLSCPVSHNVLNLELKRDETNGQKFN